MTPTRTLNPSRRPSTSVSPPGHLSVFAIRRRCPVTDTDADWLTGPRFIFFADVIQGDVMPPNNTRDRARSASPQLSRGEACVALSLLLLFAALLWPGSADASRIKDVARWEGVESNQILGIGLVVGLQGTGDGQASRRLLKNVLASQEIDLDINELRTKNVAVVSVTATMPAFSRAGNQIDVTVGSLGDARSLSGGVLLPTMLRRPDGEGLPYAVAAGPLAIGGFSASAGGASKTKNHLTVGRVPEGGKIVQEVAVDLLGRTELHLSLREPDFSTAVAMAKRINADLLGDFAWALDSGTLKIAVPPQYQGRVTELAARVDGLEVAVDGPARVVINERTGTVVMGSAVRIREVAVAHGGLTIQVDSRLGVSQPGPFSGGDTVVTPETTLEIEEQKSHLQVLEGVSIGEVVGALNALGVAPRDLMSILQAIRQAGALDAELEVI
jgi:flagellar P-ring protein FlgI